MQILYKTLLCWGGFQRYSKRISAHKDLPRVPVSTYPSESFTLHLFTDRNSPQCLGILRWITVFSAEFCERLMSAPGEERFVHLERAHMLHWAGRETPLTRNARGVFSLCLQR